MTTARTTARTIARTIARAVGATLAWGLCIAALWALLIVT